MWRKDERGEERVKVKKGGVRNRNEKRRSGERKMRKDDNG